MYHYLSQLDAQKLKKAGFEVGAYGHALELGRTYFYDENIYIIGGKAAAKPVRYFIFCHSMIPVVDRYKIGNRFTLHVPDIITGIRPFPGIYQDFRFSFFFRVLEGRT